MANSNTIKLILILVVMVFLMIALATKAAHWDRVTNKGNAKDHYPEVYPGLEGCIAVDVILIVGFIVAVVFHFNGNFKQYSKYLVLSIGVMLLIRLILAILFLAGDDQYVKRLINYCDNTPDYICYRGGNYCYSTGCGESPFKTLKGAWIWEIITIIVANLLSIAALYLIFKEGSS